MEGTPDSTEKWITLIAQGKLDLDRAPQLLDGIFDAQDYLTILRGYSKAQQYIDGLYKVYCSSLCEQPFHLASIRFIVTSPLIRRHAKDAFGDSGRPEEKRGCFQPATISYFNLRDKMRCPRQVGASQKFGRRTAQPAPLLRLRSFV